MTTRPRNEAAVNALRMIPAKWAVVVIGVLIAYVVLQPRLNQWFGWSLPSVASLVGDEKAVTKKAPHNSEAIRKSTKDQLGKSELGKNQDAAKSNEQTDQELAETIETTGVPRRQYDDNRQSRTSKSTSKSKKDFEDSSPLYGFLNEIGPKRYESAAGLVYGPGSEEGHRLKHIARHLEDQPDRPGSHGVFKGEMKAFLETIDEAYLRAKKGAKGTTKMEDDGSMVYEVTFEKAIGFIGGEAGGRKKNPPTKKIRVVVRGDNVITAFPF